MNENLTFDDAMKRALQNKERHLVEIGRPDPERLVALACSDLVISLKFMRSAKDRETGKLFLSDVMMRVSILFDLCNDNGQPPQSGPQEPVPLPQANS